VVGADDLAAAEVGLSASVDYTIDSIGVLVADGASFFPADSGVSAAAVLADEVGSANIAEADGTTGQDTNTGTGVKTGHIQNGAISTIKLKNNAVKTAKIAGGAVTSAKIADGAVANAKLANNAVNSAKIADGTVGTADLANKAVTTIKLKNNAVKTAKIADGAVTSAKIADNSITAADLAASSVGTSEIATGAVTDAKITGPISAAKLDLTSRVAKAGDTMTGQLTVNTNVPIDTTNFTGLGFQYYPSSGEGAIMSSYNDGYASITFYTKNGSGQPVTQRMKIDRDGDVGIGTASPSSKLDVAGNIETTGNYTYSTAKTGYVNLTPKEFTPVNSATTAWNTYITWGYLADPGSEYVYAPLHLPDGALVTDFRCFYRDNTASGSLAITTYLTRKLVTSTTYDTMATASLTTSVDSTAIQQLIDTSIVNGTVNSGNYQYMAYLSWNPTVSSSSLEFHGCRIAYQVSTVSP